MGNTEQKYAIVKCVAVSELVTIRGSTQTHTYAQLRVQFVDIFVFG